jgi:toxin ParE1/3/4
MPKIRFTKKAVNDLTDIWNYTVETWSESQADHYYNLILNACNAPANQSNFSKVYEEIYPELKGEKISKHIIFYRVKANQSIEIERILHERMDLKKNLK